MSDLLRWVRAEWDRAAGVALIVAGAGCLVVGYAGAAGATYVPQALSFIASGGFFGLLLVVVGATLLVTAALHDEWRKLDRIEKAIDRLASADSPTATITLTETGKSPSSPSAAVEAPSVPSSSVPPPSVLPPATVAPPGESAAVLAVDSRRAGVAAGGSGMVLAVDSRRAGGAAGGPGMVLAVDSRRLVAVAAGGLAAAALVAGGWRATASAVTDSTAYSTVRFGIAGVVLAAAVSGGWTLSLRRAARARRASLLAPFAAVVAESGDQAKRLWSAGGADGRGVRIRPAGDGRVAVAEGLTRFHTPGCVALGTLAVRLLDEADAVRTGHTRCLLCDPAG